MFGSKLVFWWCCALLLVASKHHSNFTNDNEKRNISKAQYKIDQNSIKNYVDEKEIDISTIYKFNGILSNDDSNKCIIPHMISATSQRDVCKACCHLEDHLNECIPGKIKAFHAFVEEQYSLQSKNQEINLTAYEILYDPCQKIKQFYFKKYSYIIENVLIANGTVYFPYHTEFVESKSFCLMDVNGDILRIGCNFTIFNINFPTEIVSRILIYNTYDRDNPLNPIIHHHRSIRISFRIISILFLLTTVLVYSILPQLRDKHGFILRNSISAKIVTYILYSTYDVDLENYIIESIIDSGCYFGYLTIIFWSTVMNFDMWWTFRNISSLQTNLWNLQQERGGRTKGRKKLIIYSAYAWGIPFILTIVCVIMDSVPIVMPRLEIGSSTWFIKYMQSYWYFRIPRTICSICIIYFYISTKLKIRRYKKNETNHLINADSQVYNKNKKWFNLCQKWLIMTVAVLGILAFIERVSSIFPYTSIIWYTYYIMYMTEMAYNIGIFITFVCTKKIKKLLLTRFRYRNYNVPPRARQTEVVTDSNSRTVCSSRMIHLRERINLEQTICHRNNMHDESAL